MSVAYLALGAGIVVAIAYLAVIIAASANPKLRWRLTEARNSGR
jgi:hypothetical protein